MIDTVCSALVMVILVLFAVFLGLFCVWIIYTIIRDLDANKRHQNGDGGRKD